MVVNVPVYLYIAGEGDWGWSETDETGGGQSSEGEK